MPQYFQVTLNGHPISKMMSRKEAEAMAERWQGTRYRKGLLKHADKGDWVEVKRDTDSEREFDMRYDEMKRGNPQPIHRIGGG